jgi:pimeloyl-ACP methyl ester carboxylesterase
MRTVTSNDGTRIAFEQSGEGPAIILVGGAFQQRAGDERTAQLASRLSQNFTVFNYDRRGRGDSGDRLPYAVAREREDLQALLNEAGGAAFVFGMSSGAVLALKAAAQGLSIKKLALYEPPFNSGDDQARAAAKTYTQQLTALLAENRRGDAAALAMTTWGTPAEAIEGMRQSPMWSSIEAIAPTLAYDDAIMGDGSVPTQEAKAVKVPTLVLDGGNSPGFMHQAADDLAKILPNAQRRTLQEQTHAYAPEVLAPVLEEFFLAQSSRNKSGKPPSPKKSPRSHPKRTRTAEKKPKRTIKARK